MIAMYVGLKKEDGPLKGMKNGYKKHIIIQF